MIQSKADLHYYLNADRKALGHTRKAPKLLGDEEWKFQRALRYQEYYHNTRTGIVSEIAYRWYKFVTHSWAVKLGFTISVNCCGPGLQLPHRGTIVINDEVRIGKNCRIHVGVNIGAHKGQAPVIGDDVYIGPGAKIFGGITIADQISIGANAVVNRSFITPNTIVASPPAVEILRK